MARRSTAVRRLSRGPTFSWIPRPERRETAVSFLSRLAWMNGRSIADLRTETGIRCREIDLGEEPSIRFMSTLCGMGVGPLARWSPRRLPDRSWHLHGQSLGIGQIDRTFFRFCPACIEEDLDAGGPGRPHMRSEWTIPAIRTCRKHGLMLAAASPEREFFAPYDFAGTIIPMASDMRRLAEEAVRPAPVPLEAYLTDRLLTGTKTESWLDGLSFHAAADLSEIFGAVATHGKEVRITTLSLSERIEAGTIGHAVLAEGKAGIRRFLLRLIRKTRNGKGVWGPQLAIGRINDFLDDRKDDPGYGPAVDYVREILVEEVPLDPDVVVLGRPVGDRRVWNLRSLAREVDTTVPLLKKILVRNGYLSPKADFRASRLTVDTDEVRSLVDRLDDEILTLPEVVRRTGLTRRHVEAIVQAGGFVSITGAAKVYNAQHRFAARNIDQTMDVLLRGESVDRIPAGMATLADARLAAICTFSEVLGLVLGGRLSRIARRRGAQGLDAILVPKSEVVELTKRQVPTGLTRINVQRRTGLTQKPVQKLFEKEVFDLRIRRNPTKRNEETVATVESVDRFMRDHITLHALAKHHGLHFLRMKAVMKAARIEPVFDPVEFSATFYVRSAAEQLDVAAIDPDEVVLRQRTRQEIARRLESMQKAQARPAAEIQRALAKKQQLTTIDEVGDQENARRWTRLGRSRRLEGVIGRRRVPSRRWTAERTD